MKKMIAALKSRRGVRVSPKEQGAISVFHTMSCRTLDGTLLIPWP